MPDTKHYRNRRVAYTPDQRANYKVNAQRVDREEKTSIVAQARRAKTQAEMLRGVLHDLKAERETLGLTLTEVSNRSGIDTAALSRLENAKNANPKLDTLTRYAQALGLKLTLSATHCSR